MAPLAPKVVVVTRPRSQADSFAVRLSALGFQTIVQPAIEIADLELDSESCDRLRSVAKGVFDILVFSSINGVRAFVRHWNRHVSPHVAVPERTSIAAQGRRTAESVQRLLGRRPNVVPERAVAEDFVEALVNAVPPGSRILAIRARETREVIIPALIERGFAVQALIVYRTSAATLKPDAVHALASVPATSLILTFFSPSAFQSTYAMLGERADAILSQAEIVSIGPITSRCITEAGLTVSCEAREQSEEGVLQVLRERYL